MNNNDIVCDRCNTHFYSFAGLRVHKDQGKCMGGK